MKITQPIVFITIHLPTVIYLQKENSSGFRNQFFLESK